MLGGRGEAGVPTVSIKPPRRTSSSRTAGSTGLGVRTWATTAEASTSKSAPTRTASDPPETSGALVPAVPPSGTTPDPTNASGNARAPPADPAIPTLPPSTDPPAAGGCPPIDRTASRCRSSMPRSTSSSPSILAVTHSAKRSCESASSFMRRFLRASC